LLPSNTVAEIIDKKRMCLENGSREFWSVDIEHRQVEVSTPDGRQYIPLFFAACAQLAVDSIFSSKKGLPDYKPVSVPRFLGRGGSHSSWPGISSRLQRPTRKS